MPTCFRCWIVIISFDTRIQGSCQIYHQATGRLSRISRSSFAPSSLLFFKRSVTANVQPRREDVTSSGVQRGHPSEGSRRTRASIPQYSPLLLLLDDRILRLAPPWEGL